MKKNLLLAVAALASIPQFSLADNRDVPSDSSRVIDIEEVVVVASPKENFKLREQPSSVSLFSQESMERLGINSVKGLSSHARNLFIPDYGSRLTSAMYIRGIGSRINSPAVGLYIDNMPCNDKSAFDFMMLDAERADVLNGPQATLYGRNAMGGIIRMYTTNPMRKQGTTISLGATGRTTGRRISAVTRHKLSDSFAFLLGGYWAKENGFFRNDSTRRKTDNSEEAGARTRAVYKPAKRLTLDMQLSYNYTSQGAYPYYYTGKSPSEDGEEAYPQYIGKITANRKGTYRRNMLTAGLSADYKLTNATISSVTSWQYLNDRMFMDQDFIAADIYSLEQRQRNNSISEELTYKTTGDQRWQSVSGLFAMHQSQHTSSPVTFYSDGISMLNGNIAGAMPTISQENPYTHQPMNVGMSMEITDSELAFRGRFRTPVSNYAVFHQSTIKDFLVRKLSLVLGLRLDYEHQSLDFCMPATETAYTFATTMSKAAQLTASTSLGGTHKDDYLQLLPKAALQYTFDNRKGNVYVSFSKGFRSGGYNIQMCSELAQTQMRGDMMRGVKDYCDNLFQGLIDNARTEQLREMFEGIKQKVDDNIPDINAPGAKTLRYKPECSYNYEAGVHLNPSDGLQIDAALFYMQTHNQQISRFSENGLGRQMVNAGKSACCGAELGVRSSLAGDRLDLSLSYGFTHSEFRKYNDGQTDYRGKTVPFVPAHNMSIAAEWRQPIARGLLQAVSLGADVTGAGCIYWTESNTSWQDFYANLGAHITLHSRAARLNLWGKNLTGAHYDVFHFESMNRGFSQHAMPCHFGADITFDI